MCFLYFYICKCIFKNQYKKQYVNKYLYILTICFIDSSYINIKILTRSAFAKKQEYVKAISFSTFHFPFH
ncbi:hypothetical protein EZS27_010467 [termite gut metagenome]|uniref:Uncharacterized protein n=1 Tax=termite gut metagenome TaxID=433724 RepID=A0A5J4S7T1_9ZZZZ